MLPILARYLSLLDGANWTLLIDSNVICDCDAGAVELGGQGFLMHTQYIYLNAMPSESLTNAFLIEYRNFVYNRIDVIELFYSYLLEHHVTMQAAG